MVGIGYNDKNYEYLKGLYRLSCRFSPGRTLTNVLINFQTYGEHVDYM